MTDERYQIHISKDTGYTYANHFLFEDFDFSHQGKVRCVDCERILPGWYAYLLEQLEQFLPKDFDPLCCFCQRERRCGERY